MKKSKTKNSTRFALSLFFSVAVFLILLASLILTGLIIVLFLHFGIFTPGTGSDISYLSVILMMVVLSQLIGTFITSIVIHIPMNPVNSIIDGMKKLAEGDYKARVDMGRIIGKLQSGTELIESFNTLASELESTEMLRSDFINNFSHEFKTPIVSIAGFAKLLKRGNLSEEQKREYLDIIEEESMRLSYMATNVLNLTKVENQSILTNLSHYNLSEQIRNCVLLLESKWDRKALEFSLEFGEIDICANEELMKQVWLNLIDNAIKFSPHQGTVTVTIGKSPETVSVSVSNSGAEISPETREKIFNKFYQADESHSTEGNGVGLAIVKKIVELHKGTVDVHSHGGVNRFTVKLPVQV